MFRYLFFILFLLGVVSAEAQYYMAKGDNYFYQNNFAKAIEFFQKETDNRDSLLRVEAMEKLAAAYSKNNQPHLALAWYKNLYIGDKDNPKRLKEYALAYKNVGNYKSAKKYFKKYELLNPDDSQAASYAASCDSAMLWIEQYMHGIEVKEMKFMNTPKRDFSPALYKKEVVFNSSRDNSLAESGHGKYSISYLDFYTSKIDQSLALKKQPIPVHFTGLNSSANEGPATFAFDDKIMFFTRSVKGVKAEGKKINHLNIFYRKKEGNSWGEAKNDLPFNSNLYSCGHPALSPDGEILFFFSDKTDTLGESKGGADLYYSRWENGQWSSAINLGSEINTAGNELFPTLSSDGSTLYFASNGHIGLGGLDIYASDFDSKRMTFSRPRNLKMPINSFYDDFSFLEYLNNNKGFFTSNRPKGSGNDDIYSFAKIKSDIFVAEDTMLLEDRKLFDEMEFRCIDKDSSYINLNKNNAGFVFTKLKDSLHYEVAFEKDGELYNIVHLKNRFKKGKTKFKLDIKANINPTDVHIRLTDGFTVWQNEKVYIYKDKVLIDTAISNKDGLVDYFIEPHHPYTFLVIDSGFVQAATSKILKGVVWGNNAAIADAKIRLNVNEGVFDEELFTDSSGSFKSLIDIKPSYTLQVSSYGFYSVDTTLAFNQEKKWGDTLFANIYLQPKPVMEISSLLLYKNTPVADAEIVLLKDNRIVATATSDKQGKYKLKINPDEEYNIAVTKQGFFLTDTIVKIAVDTKDNTTKPLPIKMQKLEKNKTLNIANIYFDYNSFAINAKSKVSIQKIARFMKTNPQVLLELSSHTDVRGNDNYNLILSQKRSEAATQYLFSLGIPTYSVIPKGYGETMPLVKNATTEEEHAKNRRTQIKIVDFIDTADIDITYRVHVATLDRGLAKNHPVFSKLPDLKLTRTTKNYMYFLGPFKEISEAEEMLNSAEDAGFSTCFIEKLNNGILIEKID